MKIICPKCGEVIISSGLGRKKLNHSVKNVYDIIERTGSITQAAKELGYSRAYIYKVLKEQTSDQATSQ